MKKRCEWCGSDPLYVAYHDEEWGVPVHDDRLLFEFLLLEGAQAGLSWLTILKKRDAYRRAFHEFDYERIARYGEADVVRLLADPGIVRNRRKVEAAITNARCGLRKSTVRWTPTCGASSTVARGRTPGKPWRRSPRARRYPTP